MKDRKKLYIFRAYVSRGARNPDAIVAVHATKRAEAQKRVESMFTQFDKYELGKEWGNDYLDVIKDGHIQLM